MLALEKYLLANMIVQGIEDAIENRCDAAETLLLWNQAKEILCRDQHIHTINYWACIGEAPDEWWHITPKMRELHRVC